MGKSSGLGHFVCGVQPRFDKAILVFRWVLQLTRVSQVNVSFGTTIAVVARTVFYVAGQGVSILV